jgi:hypothetical protein
VTETLVELRGTFGGRTHRLTLRAEGALDRGDAAFAAWLIPAMRAGTTLTLEQPVSAALLATRPQIQDLLRSFDPRLKAVDVQAPAGQAPAPPAGRRLAAFYSGGVDSLYTLLENREAIDALVWIDAFDHPPAECDGPARALAAEAARAFGKQLVVVRSDHTTKPEITRQFWLNHGGLLAAVAHVLAGGFSRVLVSSSHAAPVRFPWGSRPDLDPLWGGGVVEIVHWGAHATRFAKVERVASDPDVLRLLRVCPGRSEPPWNCGRCEKCVRTQASLAICGRLDAARGLFVEPFKLARLERTRMVSPNVRLFESENLAAARERGADPALVRALERALDHYHHRGFRRLANRVFTFVSKTRERLLG